MSARYIEFAPSRALADRVDRYWAMRGRIEAEDSTVNRVLPDGRTDLLFDLGDRLTRDGQLYREPRAYVVGPMVEPLVVTMRGAVDIFGVRFLPAAAALLARTPAAELRARTLPAGDLGAWARIIEEQLAEAPHPRSRVAIIEPLLLDRLDGVAPDAAVARASELIERNGGALAIPEVARRVGLSERQLGRRFDVEVGLTPKFASRVARFRRVAAAIERGVGAGISRIALAAGYYDQPHFNREFRAFSGLTPTEFIAERRAVGFLQDARGGKD